jgi:hypothetical protein
VHGTAPPTFVRQPSANWSADFAFDDSGEYPFAIEVVAREAPEWGYWRGSNITAPPPLSPAATSGPPTKLRLVPFGSTNIRIAVFPTVSLKSDDGDGLLGRPPPGPQDTAARSHARAHTPLRQGTATVVVDWVGPPLAVTPIVNSWHDTAAGSAGNPHHDSVYPPSAYYIVEPLNARRSDLGSPLIRLWSDTSYVYSWPNSTRKTVVGPAALPPNTSHTCRTLFPACACCPRADCACTAGRIAATTSWDFRALDVQVSSMMASAKHPETTILQLTGNNPPWWFFNPNRTVGGFADPSGRTVGEYFSRVLDWYVYRDYGLSLRARARVCVPRSLCRCATDAFGGTGI